MSSKHTPLPKHEKSTESDTPPPGKKCFVIMPISDMDGYDTGHFNRVYKHIISPACEKLNITPTRADEVAAGNYIIIDILKKILDSEMAICDISGRNPNVLYELGIRHAFNLPTVIIKDKKTINIFDIQGLRYTEYHESLRIDEAAEGVSKIANALTETMSMQASDVNSLIQLLAIKPAQKPTTIEISNDTSMLLSAINDINKKISIISNSNAKGRQITSLANRAFFDIAMHDKISEIKNPSLTIDGVKVVIGDHIYDKSYKEYSILKITPDFAEIMDTDGNASLLSREEIESGRVFFAL